LTPVVRSSLILISNKKTGEIMRKLFTIVLSLVAFIGISISSANAKTLKCQTVLNTKADEVKMLKDFTP